MATKGGEAVTTIGGEWTPVSSPRCVTALPTSTVSQDRIVYAAPVYCDAQCYARVGWYRGPLLFDVEASNSSSLFSMIIVTVNCQPVDVNNSCG